MDIYLSIENLRKEIQDDRLALTRQINDGFAQVNEKLDGHVERIARIEDRQNWMSKGLWGTFLTLLGSVGAYLWHR